MTDWQNRTRRFTNVLVKVIGIGFIVAGSAITIWAFSGMFTTGKLPNFDDSIIMVIAALVVTGLGVMLLLAKPYRVKRDINEKNE